MVKISVFQSPSLRLDGRLKCLHGKVDTTISCVCTCTVGSTQCSGCMVYGLSAMAAIYVLLLIIIIIIIIGTDARISKLYF